MKRPKEKVYFCENEEEWIELFKFLQEDKWNRWASGSRPICSGRITIPYQKEEADIIFLDEEHEMTFSSIDYAKRWIRAHSGTDYEVYWVKDLKKAKNLAARVKPNLPTI